MITPTHPGRDDLRAAPRPSRMEGALGIAALVVVLLLSHSPLPPSLGGAGALAAQSIVRGEIEGTVRTPAGAVVPEVALTLIRTETGLEHYADGRRDGSFVLSMLEAGDYDLLVEALGYVPRLVRGVRLRAGEAVRIGVILVPSQLPPQRIDTVEASVAGNPRLDGEAGRWIRGVELDAYRDPVGGLASIAALAPHLDGALGSEGLPGTHTRILLDGIPFTPAAHPMQRGQGALPLFPRSSLANASVHRRADVEWTGAAGSYLAATSQSAAAEPRARGFASGSAGGLWSSDAVPDPGSAGAGSFRGGATVHLPLGDARGARLLLGAEGAFDASPHPSPFPTGFGDRLVGAREPGEGVSGAELETPWSLETRSMSALARLDARVADQADVLLRATFARTEQSTGPWFTPAPGAGTGAGSALSELPFEGTDLSIGATVLAEAHRLVTVEFRGAIERSTRTWSGPEGRTPGVPLPATWFVGDGVLLGGPPGLAGEVERTGFLGSALGHYRQGPHWVKAGLDFGLASHRHDHAFGSTGTWFLGGPEALAAGGGVLHQLRPGSPATSFSIPTFGLFAQYRWEPMRGVRLTSGIRFDREFLPRDRVRPAEDWAVATGLLNQEFGHRLRKISPRLSVAWDLSGDGTTVLEGSMAAHWDRFDPAAMAEVIAHSENPAVRTLVGEGATPPWPALPSSQGLEAGFVPSLALFGPQLEAPRTARASGGLSQRLGNAAVLHLNATFRRTEFLLRRSDLNRAAAPASTLEDGRPVWGELGQWGAVIGPVPGTGRRFGGIGPVWALTADGVSEHMAVGGSLELAPTPSIDLVAGYTWSTTEDNLPGAGSGNPLATLPASVPTTAGARWEEGTGDLDVPHRVSLGARIRLDLLQGAEIAGSYRFASGLPYTPGYRTGVDVNGDGSATNDPAFIPAQLPGLSAGAADCLGPDRGRVAARNGCRSDGTHTLNLHLSLGLVRVGGSIGALTVDLFNLLDAEYGRPDPALLLVDPDASLMHDSASGVTTIPWIVNPSFGQVTHPLRPGRRVTVGFSVGRP